jgi:hypothetical protein
LKRKAGKNTIKKMDNNDVDDDSRFELPKPQIHLKFPDRVNVDVDLSVKVQGIPTFPHIPPIPSRVQVEFTGIPSRVHLVHEFKADIGSMLILGAVAGMLLGWNHILAKRALKRLP